MSDHAAVLISDAANLTDVRDETDTTWDTLLTARLPAESDNPAVSVKLALLWWTTVRVGDDPYMQYRVTRDGVEIYPPDTLSAAAADAPPSRFGFEFFDQPDADEGDEIVYRLQARGVGYSYETTESVWVPDSTYWVPASTVWVPPVTTSTTTNGTAYGSAGCGGGGCPGAPSGCSGSSSTLCQDGALNGCPDGQDFCQCTTSYTCTTTTVVTPGYYDIVPGYYATTPGYWTQGAATVYSASTGLVAFRRGTGLYAKTGIDTITEDPEE